MNRGESLSASRRKAGASAGLARNGGPPPGEADIRVLHAAAPGRVRLAVPGLKRDPERARRLEDEAARWPGVRRAAASDVTGNLVLEFSPGAASAERLAARVGEAVQPTTGVTGRARGARRRRPANAEEENPLVSGVKAAVATLEEGPVPPPLRPRTRALEVTAAAALLVGAGALLMAVRSHGHSLAIDQAPLELAEAIHSPALTVLMRGASRLVDPEVVVPVTAAATVMGVGRRAPGEFPWLAPVAVAGGGVLLSGLKLLLHRARPAAFAPLTRVRGYSLPSGHAFMAMCLYGLLTHHGLRWLRARRPDDRKAAALLVAAAALAVLMVGVSRVYLGVHYPTDVMAGYALGLLWLQFLAGVHGRQPGVVPTTGV